MVKDKEGTITVLKSAERWFGMTYPEDKKIVCDELALKIKDGYYPEKLWTK